MASPTATGGAGETFESQVAASYLASVLLQGSARGLPDAVAREVRLQRAELEGEPLDDVLVEGVCYRAGKAKLALQVKREIKFSAKNAVFLDVIERCWQTFSNDGFNANSNRVGVATGVYSRKADAHVQSVISWARHSSSAADFLLRIEQRGVAHDDARAFVAAVRAGLTAAAGADVGDDALWRFIQCLVVLHFDFKNESESRDLVHALDRLGLALAPEQADRTADLWDALVRLADSAKSTAGSFNRDALCDRLSGRFSLVPARDYRRDLERVHRESRRVLGDIGTRIAGVSLNRSEALDEARSALEEGDFVEIVGPPGCGKSAILKALADAQSCEGPVLALSDGRLPQDPGAAGFARHLSLHHDVEALLPELGVAGGRCLFVDGVDRIESAAGRRLLHDLLRVVADRNHKNDLSWKVVITARSNREGALDWMDLAGFRRKSVQVQPLSDEEIHFVAAAHPLIARLVLEGGPARELALNAYLLDRFIRWHTSPARGKSVMATEVDLLVHFFRRPDLAESVRIARNDLLTRLARARLTSAVRAIPISGLEPRSLAELHADDVVRVDHGRGVVRFAHDVLEDWTLCRLLRQELDRLPAFLREQGEPLLLLRPLQLLAAWVLEDEGPERWLDLLGVLEQEELQPRWRRAVLSAPWCSLRGAELLAGIGDLLLADDGRLLGDALVALRTTEVMPDPRAFDRSLIPDLSDSERLSLAYAMAYPNILTWRRFLGWLLPRLDELPALLVPELARTFEVWQQALRDIDNAYSKAIAAFADRWLTLIELDHNLPFDQRRDLHVELVLGRDGESALEKQLRKIVLLGAKQAPDLVRDYLHRAAEGRHHYVVNDVLQSLHAPALHLPVATVDFCLSTVLVDDQGGDRRLSDRLDRSFGCFEDDHRFYPASPYQGPFLLLLRAAPDQGLRLINGLCNAMMVAWRIWHRRQGRTPLPVRVHFPWGAREFWGHAAPYCWFRGMSAGPHTVESALMALELWMEEQVEAGCEPQDLVRQVLEGNDCIGAVGACISVAIKNACARPEVGLQVLCPFVTSQTLWEYDFRRAMEDRSSLPSNVIGNWLHDSHMLRPVKERNALPHRRLELRDIVAGFFVFAEDRLRESVVAQIARFPDDLPFEFEEERSDASIVRQLKNRARRWAAQGDPANYRRQPARGEGHLLVYTPPDEFRAEIEQYTQSQERYWCALRLLNWAEASLRAGSPADDLAIDEAISSARQLDASELFERSYEPGTHEHSYAAAVAAVAAAAAAFGDKTDEALLAWSMRTLRRAATYPPKPTDFRGMALFQHPLEYAARGFAALVCRGFGGHDVGEDVLRLVGHPFEGILASLFAGLQPAWEREPSLCWQAFELAARLCLIPRALLPRGDRVERKDAEDRWAAGIIDAALAEWRTGITPPLPSIPPPSIRDVAGELGPDAGGGWRENEVAFLWHLPKLFLPRVPLSVVVRDTWKRDQLLHFMWSAIEWVDMDTTPPWRSDRRRRGHGAYEWRRSLGEWCGAVSGYLPRDLAERSVVDAIWSVADEETRLSLTADLMGGLIREHFQAPESSNKAIDLWRGVCQRLLSLRGRASSNYIDREYLDCLRLMLFCGHTGPLVDENWPGLQQVTDVVEDWVQYFGGHPKTFYVLARFLERFGEQSFPDPGLRWLEMALDRAAQNDGFWREADNGDRAAIVLQKCWSQKRHAILRVPGTKKRLTRLVDLLLQRGIPLAAHLQEQLRTE